MDPKQTPYIFPFLWMHGEDEQTIRRYVRVIFHDDSSPFYYLIEKNTLSDSISHPPQRKAARRRPSAHGRLSVRPRLSYRDAASRRSADRTPTATWRRMAA